jgi:hypothetical protein
MLSFSKMQLAVALNSLGVSIFSYNSFSNLLWFLLDNYILIAFYQ